MNTTKKSTTPLPSDILTAPELDAVVRVLLYHAQPEARRALMVHCPVAYVKLCGGSQEVKLATLEAVAKAMEYKP